jgi:hypothetical protein
MLHQIFHRGAAILTGLVLAAGVGLASAPVAAAAGASASVPAAGLLYLPLHNFKSSLCLGMKGGGTANGTSAVQWTCNLHKDQAWAFPKAKTKGYVTMVNLDNKCLGIVHGSKASGAHAVAWTCNNHADQQWRAKVIHTGPNVYVLVNLNSGLCLGIAGGSKARGAFVVQARCNGHTDQHWFLSRGIA